MKKYIENRLQQICEWKGVEILEMNSLEDHIHMVVTIPLKVSISELMGLLKGRAAISLFKRLSALKQKSYWGNYF